MGNRRRTSRAQSLTRLRATCHRGSNAPAGLKLDSLVFDLNNVHTFSQWVRVHDAVKDGRMPPAAAPMNASDRRAFIRTLSGNLSEHSRTQAISQGRAVLRRLNRYEYENTVRDLLSAPWLQIRDSVPEDGIETASTSRAWRSMSRTSRCRAKWRPPIRRCATS